LTRVGALDPTRPAASLELCRGNLSVLVRITIWKFTIYGKALSLDKVSPSGEASFHHEVAVSL
jgi:hypothetical protein